MLKSFIDFSFLFALFVMLTFKLIDIYFKF
jgi:hypothetical protein